MTQQFKTLDDIAPRGKRVLVRLDLNVPVKDGRVSDATRIARSADTVRELSEKGARIILCSHFGRPKGGPEAAHSLLQVKPALENYFGTSIKFAPDCIGPEAEKLVGALRDGEILLLENTRFHAEEEKDDAKFAAALARLADLYVNDAFSVAHRANASTVGITKFLPAYAGRAMEAELKALSSVLGAPKRPVVAIVGGAKVSSKLALLENLVAKVDSLVIGGGMANTFLAAQGVSVGKSLQEKDLHETALKILKTAQAKGCRIVLPVDAVVAKEFRAGAPARTVALTQVEPDDMILDIGSASLAAIATAVNGSATLVWNGPLGAFEIPPFDTGTFAAARQVMMLSQMGKLISVAGGGDTAAALEQAGVAQGFTYVSTAGGAFLEWLEGMPLPGVEALKTAA
jgi:phosphoglycerate kinase